LTESDVFGDCDLAGKDDHQAGSDFPRRHDLFAIGKGAHLTEPPDALDLQRIELRDHLIPALVEEGWCRHGWHEQTKKRQEILVLPVRIELTTSPLPRDRRLVKSTTYIVD
jgi:hypothetical protein